MTERWDAVVVGSGFGGAVTAARLAEHLPRVLVLERGRPWPPGSFPRTPHALRDAFWAPGDGRHGLFDVWSFSGLNAIAASGLGGALIYANVLLRKPAATFARDPWPLDAAALEPHYAAVEAVLRPVAYPVGHEPYGSTPKTAAFRAAAGDALVDTPLAVAFAAGDGAPVPGAPLPDDPDNVHGLPRRTCRLVGECDVGCNDGAKHSLDHTYLSLARARGATLRTLCEAVGVATGPGGGLQVTYRQHLAARPGVAAGLLDPTTEAHRTVRADRVVLAAGTMGTNRLLLRSRGTLPGLSPRLGERFSSNADLLGFARDTDAAMAMATGPVITSTLRATAPGGRLVQVQDAGAPAVGEWLFQATEVPADVWALRRVLARRLLARLRGRRAARLGGDLARLLGPARASGNLLPLLGMGEDVAGGRFTLREDDELELSWTEEPSRPVLDALEERMCAVARALGGRYAATPLAHLITVHALGGCAMAEDPGRGVVDPWGRAFGVPGLHVADGAALPGPVGPNPSLTIAALADRGADAILAEAA